jgi:acyl dehydratase
MPTPDKPDRTTALRGFSTFRPGETGSLGSVSVNRDEVVAFATAWDPQPFHLDEAAGLASPLKGHAASGWHTASLLMRLLADNLLAGARSMGSGHVRDLRWIKPVLVGDRLSARYAVREVRPSSRGDRGYVETDFVVENQNGVAVLTMSATLIIGS